MKTDKDSICFSYDQARTIARDLNSLTYKDSITEVQAWQIRNFKQVVINKDNEIHILSERNLKLETKVSDLSINNAKLKVRSRRNLGIGAVLGAILVFLVTN